jgi:hypothetical protein
VPSNGTTSLVLLLRPSRLFAEAAQHEKRSDTDNFLCHGGDVTG